MVESWLAEWKRILDVFLFIYHISIPPFPPGVDPKRIEELEVAEVEELWDRNSKCIAEGTKADSLLRSRINGGPRFSAVCDGPQERIWGSGGLLSESVDLVCNSCKEGQFHAQDHLKGPISLYKSMVRPLWSPMSSSVCLISKKM